MTQSYEFSSSQNELIGDLSKKMNFVGILLMVGAVLSIVSGVASLFVGASEGLFDFSSIVQGVFLLLTGLWTRNAAQAFKRVVNTTGADIENMLGALGELRKLYNLQYWLAVIMLIALAVTIVFGLIAALFANA